MDTQSATLPNTQKRHYVLGATIVLFVGLAIFYNFATPLFEGLDEGSHYSYVNYLATHGSLPDLNSPSLQSIAQTHRPPVLESDPNALSWETTQPPLYYVIGAVLISWIDRSDFPAVFKTADTMSHGMSNIHTAAELQFPQTGTVLAIRVVRLFSTLLGAAIIILVYLIAARITRREDVAILASCITAFNPKFIHISSVITNDIAVACTFTLALYVAVLLVTTTEHNARRFAILSLLLGISIGLSAITKYSGLAVLMPAGIALIWYALKFHHRGTTWRTLALGILVCGAGIFITSGWFFAYNWLRYGDPLAWAQVQQANAFTYRAQPLSLSEMLAAVPMLFRSYWGIFGDGIQSPVAYDLPMWILAAAGTCGVLVAVVRKRMPAEIWLLVAAAFAILIAFVSWMRMYAVTDNSRLIMPVTATVSILISIGLLEWFPSRRRMRVTYVSGVCAAVWAFYIPTVSLLPNYNPLSYLTPAQVAALPAEGHVLFKNGIELYSVDLKSNRVNTGNAAQVTLYWRATRPITESYATVLEAFDDQDQSVGRLTTVGYLGRQFVTREWEPGRVIKIDYQLEISASRQTLARIFVGWYSPHTEEVVPIQDKDEVSAQVAMVKVRGAQAPEQRPSEPFKVTFGDSIQLDGYKACGDVLTLYWRSTGTPTLNYTIFVHALDQQGNVVGQTDEPVSYPTSYWDAGEQIIDAHSVTGLRNARSIAMGLYNPSSKERLPATHADGTSWKDNVVTIPIAESAACP